MQIPPGDAFSRNVSGSVAQPRPAPRQIPGLPQRQAQARSAPTAQQTAGAPNSPPPVERAHSVERISQGEIRRDVPRGGIIDIKI
jgi:hypothetical protein